VGEIIQAESAAPDLGAQLVDGLLGGDAGSGGRPDPLGAGQQVLAGIGEGALGSQEEQGVGGYAECRSGLDGARVPHLGLAHAQQGFLLAEIDLHVPASDIGVDEELGVEVFIRADEKGGLAIEQFGTLAQAVSQGSDDDELQRLVSAGAYNGVDG